MNLYHCLIDLKHDAKALAFASAMEQWMEHLKGKGKVHSWRLMRRKMGLANGGHRDFILEVEFDNLNQLDSAFRAVAEDDDTVERLYNSVHQMIDRVEYGLYRPFPDPERRERMCLL